jgi:hypothetical protein
MFKNFLIANNMDKTNLGVILMFFLAGAAAGALIGILVNVLVG